MMENNIDQAKQVRPGEELNLENLSTFLRQELSLSESDTLEVQQFPGGYSNLTYLLKMGDLEMVLRRPPVGAENISKGHDMGREYKVLSLVNPVYPKAPKPLVYTENRDIIGAPFYIMERVRGLILRADSELNYSETKIKSLYQNFIDNFAQLHQIDIHQSGIIEIGKPEGYLSRQVKGWSKRWQNAKTEEIPAMEKASQWLLANQPESPEASLIHNDYKFDNMILNAQDISEIKAVLDWEMSTVGDPFTDLGILLSYVSEKNDPSHLKNFGIKVVPGSFSREELVARYEEKMGKKVHNLTYYYAFALFKLGVVVQQIYYRYHKGYTQDPRFAPLIHLAKDCAIMSERVIDQGKISNF